MQLDAVEINQTIQTVMDQLTCILALWEELLCVKTAAHRLADLLKLVNRLGTQIPGAASLNEWTVPLVYRSASAVHVEWSMCCLLRRLARLSRSGLVSLVWLGRALACWAAIVQGDCTRLFVPHDSADTTSADGDGLSVASWVALVDTVYEDEAQAPHASDPRDIFEGTCMRVTLAMLGWENAEVTFLIASERGAPAAGEPLQTSADVVDRLRAACVRCAQNRFPLPSGDLLLSFSQGYSGNPSPRPRSQATFTTVMGRSCQSSYLSPRPPPAPPQPSEPNLLAAATAERTPETNAACGGSRREVRRGTLPPSSPFPDPTLARCATRTSAVTPVHKVLLAAARGGHSPTSISLCSDSSRDDAAATETATPTPALTPFRRPPAVAAPATTQPLPPDDDVCTGPTPSTTKAALSAHNAVAPAVPTWARRVASSTEEHVAAAGPSSTHSSNQPCADSPVHQRGATPSLSDQESVGKANKAKSHMHRIGKKSKHEGNKNDGCRAS